MDSLLTALCQELNQERVDAMQKEEPEGSPFRIKNGTKY